MNFEYESIWNNLKSFEIEYILFEYKSIFEILYDYDIRYGNIF